MGPMGLIGLIELIALSYKRNNNKEMFLLSFCCYCVFYFDNYLSKIDIA